jgi:hypothetical protein
MLVKITQTFHIHFEHILQINKKTLILTFIEIHFQRKYEVCCWHRLEYVSLTNMEEIHVQVDMYWVVGGVEGHFIRDPMTKCCDNSSLAGHIRSGSIRAFDKSSMERFRDQGMNRSRDDSSEGRVFLGTYHTRDASSKNKSFGNISNKDTLSCACRVVSVPSPFKYIHVLYILCWGLSICNVMFWRKCLL